MSAKVARAPKTTLVAMYVHLDATLDWDRLATLPDRLAAAGEAHKFPDVGKALYEAWLHAEQLDLVGRAPTRILDLGTGGGFFPFVCQFLGHEVVGVDLPDTADNHAGVRECLGIKAFPHRIRALELLPKFAEERFDMVTGFRVLFDHRLRQRWSTSDWAFLFDDLRDNHLVVKGRLALKVKLDDARIALFEQRGGKLVDQHKLFVFDPLL